jgi:outer membrane protein OmpA-like peptidoglycan-associated protein
MMNIKSTFLLSLMLVTTLLSGEVSQTDSDGDGVVDFIDGCLKTPKGYIVDKEGCERYFIIHANFKNNSFDVTPQLEIEIRNFVEFLKNRPQLRVNIIGHSSRTPVSGDAYNLRLSKARADAFKKEIVKRGISSSRIKTEGRGFHEPMYSNDTQEGRDKNRRLEIEFLYESY